MSFGCISTPISFLIHSNNSIVDNESKPNEINGSEVLYSLLSPPKNSANLDVIISLLILDSWLTDFVITGFCLIGFVIIDFIIGFWLIGFVIIGFIIGFCLIGFVVCFFDST